MIHDHDGIIHAADAINRSYVLCMMEIGNIGSSHEIHFGNITWPEWWRYPEEIIPWLFKASGAWTTPVVEELLCCTNSL
ncbi:MAG: hypothetical protein PVG70_08935 [Desulfobacterales bacterium]